MKGMNAANVVGSERTLPRDFDGDETAVRLVKALDRGYTPNATRGFASLHTSHVKIAQAIKRSAEEHVRDVVDPWLQDKPPLPAARVTWTGSDRRRS